MVADGGGDFFVAGAEERVAQVIARFREIADGVLLGHRGAAEADELREDIPDPMARFAPAANLRERGFVAVRRVSLGFVEASEGHSAIWDGGSRIADCGITRRGNEQPSSEKRERRW